MAARTTLEKGPTAGSRMYWAMTRTLQEESGEAGEGGRQRGRREVESERVRDE